MWKEHLALCPFSFAWYHSLPALALSLPISPMSNVQVQCVVTGNCFISPSSRGMFPIHGYLGSPEGDN